MSKALTQHESTNTPAGSASAFDKQAARAGAFDGGSMSKAKHTPGPWEYDDENDFHNVGGNAYICDCELHTLAIVQKHHQVKANARLIAAAPELLSALQAWADWSSTLEAMRSVDDPLTKEVRRVHGARIDATRAALAKALGTDVAS